MVGTNKGLLLVYKITPTPGDLKVDIMETRKTFAKKGMYACMFYVCLRIYHVLILFPSQRSSRLQSLKFLVCTCSFTFWIYERIIWAFCRIVTPISIITPMISFKSSKMFTMFAPMFLIIICHFITGVLLPGLNCTFIQSIQRRFTINTLLSKFSPFFLTRHSHIAEWQLHQCAWTTLSGATATTWADQGLHVLCRWPSIAMYGGNLMGFCR